MPIRPKNEPLPETCGDKRGTPTGFSRHYTAGETPCEPCRHARNAYARTLKSQSERRDARRETERARSRAHNALARLYPEDFARLKAEAYAAIAGSPTERCSNGHPRHTNTGYKNDRGGPRPYCKRCSKERREAKKIEGA
jgi:hypothetical protein